MPFCNQNNEIRLIKIVVKTPSNQLKVRAYTSARTFKNKVNIQLNFKASLPFNQWSVYYAITYKSNFLKAKLLYLI